MLRYIQRWSIMFAAPCSARSSRSWIGLFPGDTSTMMEQNADNKKCHMGLFSHRTFFPNMYIRRVYALAFLAVPVGYWEKEGSHIVDITDAVTPRQAPAHPVDVSGCQWS